MRRLMPALIVFWTLMATAALAQSEPGGAPLEDHSQPNVAVHAVEKKELSEARRHELALYPVAVQVNGKFTRHTGSALSYVYHLQERFGLQITPIFNWHSAPSGFNRELETKLGASADPANSLLLNWGIHAGVEATPIYGKFTFHNGTLGRFSLVLSGGAGLGHTRHQLKSEDPATGGATYGSIGNKFIGSLGGGLKLEIARRYAIRLEVRDVIYTARVDKVNGCTLEDLNGLQDDPTNLVNSGSCKASSFSGPFAETDIAIARTLVETPSSAVLNNLGFYAGFSVLF